MRLYSIQALKVLTFLLTTTSAVPANNDIEAESDLATRGIHCTTDCWSDGYGEVGVGNFSFILDYQHHCTVTLKTQEYPSAGRVYSLNANGTIACYSNLPWVLSIALSNWQGPNYCETGDVGSDAWAYYADDSFQLTQNPFNIRCSGVGTIVDSRIRCILPVRPP